MSSHRNSKPEPAPKPLPSWPKTGAMAVVGHPKSRASAVLKVTGQAEYASDVVLPSMAHAVIVRSTIPRGTVTSFDTRRARAVPGLLLALGPSDLPWPDYPHRTKPSVSADVRFVGEELGAVVAETEAAARQAARMIEVGYEALTPCITMRQALDDGAPPLAEGGNIVDGVEVHGRGSLARAKAIAEIVVDAEYSTPVQYHNCLEPHGCVAAWEGDRLTLWDSNQGGHLIREWLAKALGLSLDRVRVVSRYVGGGFGSKIILQPYHIMAATLSRELGRPVRLFMERREEFIASHHRAPTQRRIRIGATRSGRLSFVEENITGQAGPCKFLSVNAAGALNGLRLHRADAVYAEIRRVLTNTQCPSPFRGPTVAEDIFCLEQAVDELACTLDMDPLVLRQRNIAEMDLIEGLPYAGKELARCYQLGAEAFGWQFRKPQRALTRGKARGVGMGAVAYDGRLYEPSTVEIACVSGGSIKLRVGVTEFGGGADTVFAQIAAEELGLPYEMISVHFGDTDSTPRSIDASNHSRTSGIVGPVVRNAARKLKLALLDAGALILKSDTNDTFFDAGSVSCCCATVSLEEIIKRLGPIHCTAERECAPSGVFQAMFGAHFVEVEVDIYTGCVAVLRAVCAHDAGRVLNPKLTQSQVQGGFLQGMAMALQEQGIIDPRTGEVLNAAMWAYKTPSIVDAPASIQFIDAGVPDGGNSLGVKGIGEPPLIAAGAAIANAIYNAIGVRIRDYPITPGKVLSALEELRT